MKDKAASEAPLDAVRRKTMIRSPVRSAADPAASDRPPRAEGLRRSSAGDRGCFAARSTLLPKTRRAVLRVWRRATVRLRIATAHHRR